MKAVFISNKSHLSSPIPGGVQICTNEFVELLKRAGIDLNFFALETTRSYLRRIKIKLGLDIFDYYDIGKYFLQMAELIKKESIELAIINQVNLLPFAKLLKEAFGNRLKIIVLSHGNESGDYLHEILHGGNSILKSLKMGALLTREAKYFARYVDLLIVISEHEKRIAQWMGAINCIYIPRTIPKSPVIWQQVETNRIGFIGTLNHLPNLKGVELLASELDKLSFNGEFRIVGGPEKYGKELEIKFKCIKYVGFVSNELLIKEVATWGVFVNAIFWYSRGCSTKLAQIISWEIPIVSTTAGVRGYEWSNGDMIFADSPNIMAKKIADLLKNPQKLLKQHQEILKIKNSSPTLDELSEKVRQAITSLFSNEIL